jgi:hypothetical protein
MLLGPCPLSFHSAVLGVVLLLLLVQLVAVLLQVGCLLQVGHLLQQGVLQLVVLPQADLPLVLLCQQVGLLLLLPVGRELAAAVVVVVAPYLR